MSSSTHSLPRDVLRTTTSACPTCGRDCPGAVVRCSDGVYLDRDCPEHGGFALRLSRHARGYADLDRFYFDVLDGATPRGRIVNYWVLSTTRCQMMCPYCQVEVRRSGFEEMDSDDFRDIFRRSGHAKLTLSGGEPTLHPHALQFFEEAATRRLSTQLATNGVRAADARFCRSLAVAGVPEVRISLDSLGPASNTEASGDAFHSHRVKALDNLRRLGLPTILSPTIQRGVNESLLSEALEYARHNHFVREISVNGFSWVGEGRNMDRERAIMPDEMMDLVDDAHPGGSREAVFAVQKLLLIALRLLDIRLCMYTQIMVFVRDGDALNPLTDYLCADRLEAGLRWWEGFARSGWAIQRAAFARVCLGAMRRRAVRLVPSMLLLSLANAFGVRVSRYPAALLPVVLNTNCSLLSADRQVGVRCMSGVLYKKDGRIHEGRSTAMLLNRERALCSRPARDERSDRVP